jgi:hypothetical protein
MTFELLANYLEPRFGNIYEYNLDGDEMGSKPQEWTDELAEAVRDYLLHQLPDDIYAWLLDPDHGSPGRRSPRRHLRR